MNSLQSKVLFIILLHVSVAGTAQVPATEELWDGLVKAVNADIYSYRTAQREKNRIAISDSIANLLTELNKVFENPYSSEAVDRGLESVEALISNPDISEAQARFAGQLYQKLNSYEGIAQTVHSKLVLDSGDKSFQRIGKLLRMPEMAPIYVEWMSQDIKTALDDSGFFEKYGDEDYPYLNEKISYVKENLASLADNPTGDAEQLLSKLRTVLNTVNEISPDFPKVEILLDQEFKTEEE